MSEVKVNKISPRTNCGTVQLGDSGDTITIPAGATIVNNGTQTGFGRTGTVNWDTTPKTASFTAVSGNGYFVNTTSGAITVTLPAGSAGDIVSLADYAGTWQTNGVTVNPNGTDKIGGVNSSAVLGTEGQSVTFVYSDSTQGWLNTMDSTSNVRASAFITATGGTITTCGNCKIHTFTGPGTFTVSSAAACSANNEVSYMVVAGGAGGAGNQGSWGGGGGGAGGFREDKSPVTPYTASPLDGAGPITITATGYPITVGGGGSGGAACGVGSCGAGGNGNNSIFSTITSTGGGGGGAGWPTNRPGCAAAGLPGGSGGGATSSYYGGSPGAPAPGGTGNTPPVSPSQGNSGGSATFHPPARHGGGGGGAGAAGGPDSGPGGNGVTTSISGSSTAYAGGGGAGGVPPGSASNGGTGGGGPGTATSTQATAGTANTGGGGGGNGPCSSVAGAAGGSGIVIIRYKYQ